MVVLTYTGTHIVVAFLAGNIRVYCRVRPFLSSQVGRPSTVDFVGDSGDLIIVNPNKQGKDARKTFSFNKVFDVSASQGSNSVPLISARDAYRETLGSGIFCFVVFRASVLGHSAVDSFGP